MSPIAYLFLGGRHEQCHSPRMRSSIRSRPGARPHADSAELDEIGRLSYQDLEEVANDCGMTTLQLVDVIKAGPHGSDELLALMKALNIDPDGRPRIQSAQFRDMQGGLRPLQLQGECRCISPKARSPNIIETIVRTRSS